MGRSRHSRVSTLRYNLSLQATALLESIKIFVKSAKFSVLLKSLDLIKILNVLLVCYFTPCSSQMVGVIVRLEKEAFKVLTQHGKELHVPQHTVQKRNNRAVALDMNQVSLKH